MVISSARKDYNITDLGNPFQTDELRERISESLTSTPKCLPSLLLWDERGHQLFEAITKSKDYYGTAADKDILVDNLKSVCDMIGDDGILIELGSGSVFSLTVAPLMRCPFCEQSKRKWILSCKPNTVNRCLPTSTTILRALANPGAKVRYFAHDICKEQLLKSLDNLSHALADEEKHSTIELHGVIGT